MTQNFCTNLVAFIFSSDSLSFLEVQNQGADSSKYYSSYRSKKKLIYQEKQLNFDKLIQISILMSYISVYEWWMDVYLLAFSKLFATYYTYLIYAENIFFNIGLTVEHWRLW